MTRSLFAKAAAVATVATFAVVPAVMQAQTTLNFTGTSLINDPNPVVGAGNTLIIDFLTRSGATLVTGAAAGTIDAGTNDLGIGAGTTGSITDLVATSPAAFVGTPVGSFVAIGGYTFTLTGTDAGNTFGPISLFQVGANTVASFNVNGTVTGGSFGTTARNYNGVFTTQFTNITPSALAARIDAGQGFQNDFSATFSIAPASVVPEPSTYALMASGVAMLGAFARRRRQQA